MKVPAFSAQLASPTGSVERALTDPERWVVEEKFDGIRALVTFDESGLEIRNRHGDNKGRLTNAPHIERALREWAHARPKVWEGTVVDGELVADTWNATMHLLGSAGKVQGDAGGLKFIAFDMPFFEGADHRGMPLAWRQGLLHGSFGEIVSDPLLVSQLLAPTPGMVEEIFAKGAEGVMLKDRTAVYESGGRKSWFKIKQVRTADAFIVGYTAGQGKYADTIGAIKLGQYRDGAVKTVTQISGMNDETRYAVGNDRAGHLGRVIEFEFQEQTAASYRHPRFLRWRLDKQPTECTWEAS